MPSTCPSCGALPGEKPRSLPPNFGFGESWSVCSDDWHDLTDEEQEEARRDTKGLREALVLLNAAVDSGGVARDELTFWHATNILLVEISGRENKAIRDVVEELR